MMDQELHRTIIMSFVLFVGIATHFGLAIDAPTIYAHRPYVVQIAVMNHTPTAGTVAKVATSCACLTAESAVRTGETPVPPGVAFLIELMSTHIMRHDIRCCNYIKPHDIMSNIGQSHAGIGLRKAGVG